MDFYLTIFWLLKILNNFFKKRWIYSNGVKVDLKKVKQVSARQFLNPNDYTNKVNVINATYKTVS